VEEMPGRERLDGKGRRNIETRSVGPAPSVFFSPPAGPPCAGLR
jgi:hypothetical protein